MEHLAASYTEVWVPAALVPLVRFADCVRPISSTGIDLVGLEDVQVPPELTAHLQTFDSVVSWYGGARAEFRRSLESMDVPCTFLRALPPDDYRGHTATFFNEQVGAPDRIPQLRFSPAVDSPEVVMHPFSGSRRKNWPLANYRELAEHLRYEVSWSAGPAEELVDARRFDDLSELARWLAGARLYIGNDSGITHLAAALGVPTLALFGPTDPARWAPRGENVHFLRCDPIEKLPLETVLQAANRLLL